MGWAVSLVTETAYCGQFLRLNRSDLTPPPCSPPDTAAAPVAGAGQWACATPLCGPSCGGRHDRVSSQLPGRRLAFGPARGEGWGLGGRGMLTRCGFQLMLTQAKNPRADSQSIQKIPLSLSDSSIAPAGSSARRAGVQRALSSAE